MMGIENNNRRGFIKKSVFALAGLSLIPGLGFGENTDPELITNQEDLSDNKELKKSRFYCQCLSKQFTC